MSAGTSGKVWRKGRLHEEKSALRPQLGESVELPEYCGEAAVDIIAVHGLASRYESTWSVKLEDGSRYHWLREKLGADMPHARILGYEYGSDWYGDPTYTNLEECGTEFLRSIITNRRHQGRPEMCPARRKRPIIFVAHSFGGLVVKQALVTAYRTWRKGDNANSPVRETVRRAQAANYRDFLCSVAGVIFLGTPHRGSAFSFWANVKMTFGSLVGQPTYAELVKVLGANSEPLSELQRAFEEACNDSAVLDILPCCYRETRQVALPPYVVVPEESAWLDHAENGALDANHMEMNKFYPGTDANYDKVLSSIQQTFSSAARSVSRRLEKWRYGSIIAEDDRNVVEHRLDPSHTPQIQHFQSKLSSYQAAPYTCKWLEQHDCFKAWKSGSGKHNVLWIHGKPASGKSVLSAYTISALRRVADAMTGSTYSPCRNPLNKHACGSKLTKPAVLYFFCGVDRSHDRPQGLLGTLIHQLLTIHDTDEMMFATVHRWKEMTPVTNINGATLTKLMQGLLSLVASPVL
jgi:Alpha/beta hydrolase family